MNSKARSVILIRSMLRKTLLCSAIAVALSVRAAPQGGEIRAGEGSISAEQNATTIRQLSDRLVIDWSSFNIAQHEHVQFIQPTASSAALNHILDQNPSQIFGSVTANGLLFLINPNGIIFGEGSRIEVGGLLATSLNIDAGSFMSGLYRLYDDGSGNGLIINRGLISAATGGVSLVSNSGVVNQGKILATLGHINLAATTSATLDFDGDGLLQLRVDGKVLENAQNLDDAVSNTGEIIASDGNVLLSGQTARDVFTNVVNNSGVIKASRIVNEGGVIRLVADGGHASNSGRLDASSNSGPGGEVIIDASDDALLTGNAVIDVSSAQGEGGQVRVLGNRVGLFDHAAINADGSSGGGEVLLGGDFQGSNAAIKNAAQTFVAAESRITANATQTGNGGKVIVWADKTTQYYGSIEATGMAGDGGFAEISGRDALDFNGAVNLFSVAGHGGTLLLDPNNITIENGGTDSAGLPVIAFTDSAGLDLSIDASDINTQLQAGTSVVLSAHDDITIDESIDGTGGAGALTLQAGDDVLVNQSITLDNAALVITAGDAGASPTPGAEGTADIVINVGIDTGNGAVTLTTSAANNGGDIGGSGTLSTTGLLTVDSNIGVSGLNVNLQTSGSLAITTRGDNATGNASFDDASAMNTSQVVSISTSGSGVQTTTLEANDWTINSDLTVSDAITLRGSAGDVDGNDTNRLTAAAITLETLDLADPNDGIGDGAGTADRILTSTPNLTLITGGDVLVINDTALTDLTLSLDASTGTRSYSITDASATAQSFAISDSGAGLNIALDAKGDMNLSVSSLSPGDGDVIVNGNVNAGSGTVTLQAADAIREVNTPILTAGALILIANDDDGGVAIDLTTNVDSISANATFAGNIVIDNTGALDITGITANNGTIDVTSDATISVSGNIDSTANSAINLATSANGGNVDGAGGTITTGGLVEIIANGGIGIGAALATNAGSLDLLTNGNTSTGNIRVLNSGDLLLNDVTMTTNGSGNQTIDLLANSWDINSNLDVGGDTLILRASGGDIIDTGDDNLLIAAAIGLTASGSVNVNTSAATLAASASTGSLQIDSVYDAGDNTGSLTVGSVTTINGLTTNDQAIILTSDDADINIVQGIHAGTSTISITTTETDFSGDYNIGGSATMVAGGGLTVDADGSINIITEVTGSALNLATAGDSAAGNITLVDNSDLTTADVTVSTSGSGTQTIDLSANSWDIATNFDLGNDTLVLRATGGNIIDSGDDNVLSAAAIGLDASGAINVNTVAATIAASATTGAIQLDSSFDAGDNTGAITVGSVSGMNGLVSADQAIKLTSDDADIVLTQVITAGTGSVSLTTTETDFAGDYSISGLGVITASGGVNVIADGAIDIDTAIGAGSASLTTNGNAAAGNITFSNTGNLATSAITLVTNGAGAQTLDLGASSWDIDSNVAVGSDTLVLRAGSGAITDGGDNNLLSAASIGLVASSGIDVNTVAANIAASSGVGALRIDSTFDAGDNTGTLLIGSAGGITGLSASNQNITLTSDDADINVAQNINAGAGVVALTTTETDFAGDYNISGVATISSSGLTLIADGSIDINTATGGNAINLTTNGNDTQGDITLVESDAVMTSDLALATNGSNAAVRSLNLSAASWLIDGAFNGGDNHLNLAATETSTAGTHGIFNAGGVDSINTTGDIILTSATGIGTSASPIRVSANSLAVNTTGANNDGDIYVDGSGSALSLGAVSTAASSQNIVLAADSWLLSANVDFGTDNLALIAVAGDIDDAGSFSLTANSIGLDASGNIDMTTVTPVLAANAGGSVHIDSLYSAGDVHVGTVDTISGITASSFIELFSTDASIVLDQPVSTSSGNIIFFTSESIPDSADYDVTGSGLITTPDIVIIVADGGIGTTSPVNTDAGQLAFQTSGNDAAGDVAVIIAGNQATSDIPAFAILGTGVQTIDLTADSWVNDNALDFSVDNLILRASNGNITNGGGTLSANDLSLIATAANASIGSNGATISPVSVNAAGTLTASASNGNGGIYLNDLGATAVGVTGVDAGTGNVELVSAGALTSAGSITGNDLLIIANGGVNTSTQVNTIALTTTATGDITISNSGTLNISTLTQSNSASHNGISGFDGAINISADDSILLSADVTENNTNADAASDISITTTANTGNIDGNGGTLVTGGAALLNADGGIGGFNPLLINAVTADLSTSGDAAAGNIHATFIGSRMSSTITGINTSGSGKQLVELHANNWLIDADIGNSADDLILDASTGVIDGNNNGSRMIADALGLTAASYIADSTALPPANPPSQIFHLLTDANSVSARSDSFLILLENSNSLTITDLTDAQGNIISGVSAADEISIYTSGNIALDADVTSTNSGVALTAIGGDIEGGAGIVSSGNNSGAALGNFGTLLTADGGIGLTSTVNTSGSTRMLAASSGNAAAGNININHNGNLAIGSGSGNSFVTNGSGTQTLNLTADAWIINGSYDAVDNNINLSSATGGIANNTNPATDSLATTGDISLDAATGIGQAGSAVNVAATTLTLNTAGANSAGDIYIVSGGALGLGAGISTDAGTAQNIEMQAGAWSLNSNVNFGSDNLILRATAGDIVDNGSNTLIANSVGLAATGDIDATTDAATIAANAGGTILIDSVRTTSDVTVANVGTVSGVTSSDVTVTAGNDAITLNSTDASLVVNQNISNASGDVTITTLDSGVTGDYDVVGNATVNSVGDLIISADGGIGVSVASPLNVNVAGNLAVDTSGVGVAGDIYIASASALSLGSGLSTHLGSAQNIDLRAAGWALTSNVNFGTDSLVLRATTGNISDGTAGLGGFSITADSAGFAASGNIDVTVLTGTVASSSGGSTVIDSNRSTGSLSVGSVSGINGISASNAAITLDAANDVIIDQAIVSGTGNITITSTDSITGTAGISGGALSTVSNGGTVLNNSNTVTQLTVTNAGSANIEFSNSSPTFTLAGVSQSGGGVVIITSNGNVVSSGSMSINNGGALSLSATGASTSITLNNAVAAANVNLSASAGITQSAAGVISTSLLTTQSSGGTSLALANNLDAFNATDSAGGNITLVDNGALNVTGISTAGNVSITTSGALTASGAITGNALATTTTGGATLDNPANDVSSFSASNTGAGDIVLTDTAALSLLAVNNDGNISINTSGNILQTENVSSQAGGDITVATTGGSLSMQDGISATTSGGTISYTAGGGDIRVALLDAASGTPANAGTVNVTSSATALSASSVNPSVRANTVNINAFAIGNNQFDSFLLSSDIQGTVTLQYVGNAFIAIAPNFNASLNIVDLGTGLIDSSAARSAGNQRGQSTGLEDVGFIDAALFSDVNLFVVDGSGISLPSDQRDFPPSIAPGSPDDDEFKRKQIKPDEEAAEVTGAL